MKGKSALRALVLDDDPAVRDGLARVIESSGWNCGSAPLSSGAESLHASGGGLRAVFVALGGEHPARIALAARAASPGVTLVAIADLDARRALDDALESGIVDEFISLPFSAEEVGGVMRLLERET